MQSVMISIQPKWCSLIASGKKTMEIRKTKPKNDTSYKCYIYCTGVKTMPLNEYVKIHQATDGKIDDWHGKVIGEFVCDRIQTFESEFVDDDCYEFVASLDYDEDGDATGFIEWSNDSDFSYESTDFYKKCCVKYEELKNYMGQGINEFYGWHISDLVIYDKPKELNEFYTECQMNCEHCEMWGSVRVNAEEFDMDCKSDWFNHKPIKRPPQSWCYVAEVV